MHLRLYIEDVKKNAGASALCTAGALRRMGVKRGGAKQVVRGAS